jgi:hypothetical protein
MRQSEFDMNGLRTILWGLILLISTACTTTSQVSGNGNVISLERIATNFHRIRVEDGIQVFLSQGKEERVEVTADRNLHEYIKTESQSGTLHIFSTRTIERSTSLKVYVSCKEMDRIECFGRGKVTTEAGLKSDELIVKVKDGGKANLEVDCEEIEVELNDQADLRLQGKTEDFDVSIKSNSKMDAFELKAYDANLYITQNSRALLNVSESFEVNAKKNSEVTYSGKPKNVSIKTSPDSSVKNE